MVGRGEGEYFSSLLNKLGWRATRSLQDMCDSAWAWQSNVGK